MRSIFLAKSFFYTCFGFVIFFMLLSLQDFRRKQRFVTHENNIVSLKIMEQTLVAETNISSSSSDLKYILLWTNPKNFPFVYMGEGRQTFIELNCPYTNCFVTSDRHLLDDLTNFDVIMFAGPEVVWYPGYRLPLKRSPHQKYSFCSIESSHYYPMCSGMLNSFFNWTWTYKLNSDARWGYFVIRDLEDKIIGPKTEMHWISVKDMDPVKEDLKISLKTKTKAATWLVSNCNTMSKREQFVNSLQSSLKNYSFSVDIYGKCGQLKCSDDLNKEDECTKLISKDYYFYLSFENSFADDYVTEKLLLALNHNAIPVVYGGANYTRFMPDGIYLNARELGPEKLAKKMHELINDPEQYYNYFRWRNHYRYQAKNDAVATNDYCNFCKIINDEELMKQTTVYDNFKKWWTPPNLC